MRIRKKPSAIKINGAVNCRGLLCKPKSPPTMKMIGHQSVNTLPKSQTPAFPRSQPIPITISKTGIKSDEKRLFIYVNQTWLIFDSFSIIELLIFDIIFDKSSLVIQTKKYRRRSIQ